MFSPWYADSLRDILQLEPSDIARLQRKLAADPNDFPTRLKLMAYHQRADRSTYPEDLAARARHALWLIEHHPESELLHAPVSRFSPAELSPADYRRAIALWDAAAKANPRSAAIQWNAASFFQALDPSRHMQYLEAAVAADPNHPYALRPLAQLYAQSLLDRGPLAVPAQAGLDTSKNVWVLGNAAYTLQSLYNQSVQQGRPDSRAAELAERYFLRAQALAPNLDRRAILPQLDQQAKQPQHSQSDFQARADKALAEIRRLPIDAFPDLPPAIAAALRARNCRVPQPASGRAARNVIRGDFFVKGQTAWAVLCSINNSTTLIAFRNSRNAVPVAVTTSEDRNYLQGTSGDHLGYSRQITAVGRDFILRHYRAYGGPPPPPIDHQGIDDAFLEKASTTWYFHDGKWLRLQGAD
jgi:hypothetical protein